MLSEKRNPPYVFALGVCLSGVPATKGCEAAGVAGVAGAGAGACCACADVAPSNAPGGPAETPYQDFISGPVATNPFWDEIDDVTGGQGNGELLSRVFFKPESPNGLEMICAQGSVYSYAEVTVSGEQVVLEYKDEAGQTVQDVDGEPCGPYTITPFAP